LTTIKRAYGDWTTQNLRSWKDVPHTMAIQPIQQFSYTSGKNATDSALIIDAMDVLHTGSVDGFCLVSSDSDFTRLGTRIREAGLTMHVVISALASRADHMREEELYRLRGQEDFTREVTHQNLPHGGFACAV